MKSIGLFRMVKKLICLVITIKPHNILRGLKFIRDFSRYHRTTENGKRPALQDIYPCLEDRTWKTPFDAHYFYLGAWAFTRIQESGPDKHLDIGSDIRWVGLLSTITDVTFLDIRPFETDLEGLTVKKGSLLALPYEDGAVSSLSCLHVAEHVGLGRYGDPLDPDGTEKTCRELSRVLAVDGNLYFAVPVGRERTCFNAHRIFHPRTIFDYFQELDLMEFSGVTDEKRFIRYADPDVLAQSNYACGLFRFTRKKEKLP
ncbi:MAG: DUF268 domain-containing protein [bacterium]|jgi:hypothetical protein|nr:DUF268 domain-containing protein [bacterium]